LQQAFAEAHRAVEKVQQFERNTAGSMLWRSAALNLPNYPWIEIHERAEGLEKLVSILLERSTLEFLGRP